MQGSLGGGARTSVIVTIPQGDDVTGEVLNALKFASRANQVKVEAKVIRYVHDTYASPLLLLKFL